MNRIKTGFQILIFFAGFVLIWIALTNLMKPKFVFHSKYMSPELETWESFYDQEDASLDILYIGSSHVYNAVNPAVIYEETGFTGHVLGSSDQDMAISYYYLKEAIGRQNPQIVFLDSFYLKKPCFTNEDNYKRSYDYMKWGSVKQEAIESWLSRLPDETKEERVFTLLSYHTRWDDIREEDFLYRDMENAICGYCPVLVRAICEREQYYYDEETFSWDDTTITYFQKIVDLCENEGIQLVLFTAPASYWTLGDGNTVQYIAEHYDLSYLDMNTEQEFVETLDMNIYNDFRDANHLNIFGADKVSKRLADQIKKMNLSQTEKTEKTEQAWEEYCEKWHTYEAELIAIDNAEE